MLNCCAETGATLGKFIIMMCYIFNSYTELSFINLADFIFQLLKYRCAYRFNRKDKDSIKQNNSIFLTEFIT